MKVLYISYDGMTDPLGQSQVIPYLIGLSKKYQLTIISCEKEERYLKQQININYLLSKYKITWIPVSYSTLPSILSKQWNIVRMKRKAIAFVKKEHPEVVHCRSYMAALIGLYLKNKFHLKFIFDMRGFWADERMDGGIWLNKKWIHRLLYRYFKNKELEFLAQADYTISLTETAKSEIFSWKQFQNQKPLITVIPCCADLNHFSTTNTSTEKNKHLKNKLGISESDLVLTYLGSIGTWYMLDEMLDFFSVLNSYIPKFKFLFITTDDPAIIYTKAKHKHIAAEKIIVTAANRNEVPGYLSLSTASIYFIKPAYSKIASSPTKTGELLAMGIPVITNSGIGDSKTILETNEVGLIINSFSKESYKQIINQFSLLLQVDKRKLINVAHHYFSLEKGIALYEQVYSALDNKRQHQTPLE